MGQYDLHPTQHIVIPHSYHPKSLLIEIGCPSLVMHLVRLCSMLRTIHFDDQSLFKADEVHHIGADGHLAAKFQPRQTAIAQLLSQFLLCLCGIPSQSLGNTVALH